MVEQEQVTNKALSLKYPPVHYGYLFSIIASLAWIAMFSDILILKRIIFYLYLLTWAGIIYWLWCVLRLHSIVKKISAGKITRESSQVLLYFLIPFINVIWAFRWSSRTAGFLNTFQQENKISPFIAGLTLSLAVFSVYGFFPLFLLSGFLVLQYFIQQTSEIIAQDLQGANVIQSNIIDYESALPKKKNIIGALFGFGLIIAMIFLISLPNFLLLGVSREGVKLIPYIQAYKDKHGEYPPSLNELGITIPYANESQRGFRYYVDAGRKEFSLACFVKVMSLHIRDVYRSKTKSWERID